MNLVYPLITLLLLLQLHLKHVVAWSTLVHEADKTAAAAARAQQHPTTRRRAMILISSLASALALDTNWNQAAVAVSSLTESATLVQQARQQLEAVPDLIKKEQWDAIRAVLITPPLADCWAKTSRPLLGNYAQAVGDAGGDEFAALEAKEEANSHLRYLDMAAYNNNFNPIKTEGETGATATLIRSYYQDPMNEWNASVAAMDDLLKLQQAQGQ